VECQLKIQRKIHFSLSTISTDNPSIVTFAYIQVLEGDFLSRVSLDISAMNSENSGKIVL
jgi:hypothetical protein